MTAGKQSGREEKSDSVIRAALGRVIASPVLAKSPQLAHFLTFIVEETLAGRGDRLKAYTIATDALGREASFDPQTDPIVRVDAGRLRRALEQHYATDGRNDPLIIDLPIGHYTPIFRDNAAPCSEDTRLQIWRRAMIDSLRENIRLVLLVAVVAATVSLSFNFLWMLIGMKEPPFELNAEHVRAVETSDHAPGTVTP